MEGRLLLKNCALFRPDGRIRRGMAVLVDGGLIRRVAPDAELPVLPGDWEVACRGRLVSSGLVDGHSHLVGAQVRASSADALLHPPHLRLQELARREARLTVSDVETLTTFGLARAVRSGVSLVVDHLSLPHDVAGGLAAQARAAERLGVRLVASHSTRGRGEDPDVLAQLEANAAFATAQRDHPLVRGALGFHSSSTSDDALLRWLGRTREETGLPVVFHLSENDDDLATTFSLYGRRVVPRLEAFGLLGPGVVAAYARLIDRSEAERLARSRTFLALSPQVSLLTELGTSGLEAAFSTQALLGLATSGQGALRDTLLAALLSIMQLARVGRLIDPDSILGQLMIDGPAELCTLLYGAPSGAVEAGRLADLVVYDHVPVEDSQSSLAPSLSAELANARAAWTIVNGRVLMREGQVLGVDYLDLAEDVRAILTRVRREPSAA